MYLNNLPESLQMCLMFRVGDMRNTSSLVGAEMSVQVVQRRVTKEGEIYDDVTPIKATPDSNDQSCLIIIWRMTCLSSAGSLKSSD